MKLINKTKWNTKDLRKLCLAIIKNKGSSKNHIINIVGSKSQYHGRATLNGSWIKMLVPPINKNDFVQGDAGSVSKVQTPRSFDAKTFAQILDHEIDHNLGGMHNSEMCAWWNKDVSHVETLQVRPQEELPKPKIDYASLRKNKAQDKVKELETKLKRTQNLLKKWQKKVKYYENRKLTLS